MKKEILAEGLAKLGSFITDFLMENAENQCADFEEMRQILRRTELENPWFTQENLKFSLKNWAENLTLEKILAWISNYRFCEKPKNVGLILAGNIPLVGFHDVVSTVLSGNIPLIKMSSKDRLLLPFLMKKWREFSGEALQYSFVEKLQDFDAVIATGSNNTAQYLEQYFKNYPALIRKNRTSAAVLDGRESDGQLRLLAKDIFTYFGLGCRNVTRLFLPQDMLLDRLFENFVEFGSIINHHKYANNYDYNKALFLLNGDIFWDNNFVMLRETDALFSPLSMLNFSRYGNLREVEGFIAGHASEIQCIVAAPSLGFDSVDFGEAQNPELDTYADNVDTMRFLEVL